MRSQARITPVERPHVETWSATTRLAFRFCFLYFPLYSLATQLSGDLFRLPGLSFPGLGPLWPMRMWTIWVATRVWHVRSPLAWSGNSGDTNFFWVQTSWILALSLIGVVVWSVPDSRRTAYAALHNWLRLFVRFALAAEMLSYGMAKVIPSQMPAPSLVTLVEPVGNLSLQGLLWTSIGASKPYEIFTGFAEVVAGILLLVPRTTMLGAVLTLVSMIQVFVLNLTYDVGVKLISFHLIVMSLFLLAPDFERLASVFWFDRGAAPPRRQELFRTERANRLALAAQVGLGIYLVVLYVGISQRYWYGPGGEGRPKSPLYGIWNVERLAVDGDVRPSELNDYDRRWRRVIFDEPDIVVFQRTDDSLARYGSSIDAQSRAIALTKGASKTWRSTFRFERPADDRLVLTGDMDGHAIRAELRLVDFDTFRLLNSTFRWVRPPDPVRGEN
jgi:hypothetical protein